MYVSSSYNVENVYVYMMACNATIKLLFVRNAQIKYIINIVEGRSNSEWHCFLSTFQ